MTPKIPGTFKTPPLVLIRAHGPRVAQAENLLLRMGSLYARSYTYGECSVMVSRDRLSTDNGFVFRWHISIAHSDRYPTYDDLKAARYLAEELKGVPLMAQLFPKVENEDEWVDLHKNALHMHEIIDTEVMW